MTARPTSTLVGTGGVAPSRAQRRGWTALAAIEVGLAALAVLADLLVPTVLMLGLAGVSLLVRHQGLGSLGLVRLPRPGRSALHIGVLTLLWSAVVLALLLPVLQRLTGERQDLSSFAELEGDLGLLVVFVALSWTLAAFGEELAYRGLVLTRLRGLLPTGRAGAVAAVLTTSVLFGLAHTEQGVVGVVVTTADAVYFSALRYRFRSLWAAVLAHGFSNTLGLMTFFVVGPVYALW